MFRRSSRNWAEPCKSNPADRKPNLRDLFENVAMWGVKRWFETLFEAMVSARLGDPV